MSKPISMREADFKRELLPFTYPSAMKDEFFDYWTEPDRAPQPKMRFEKEKTWSLSRRLARWAKNGKEIEKKSFHMTAKKMAEPITNEEKLDAFIDELRKPGIGINIPFEHFGDWYEYMKEQRLLKPFTKNEVEELKTIYNNDNQLCRCAVVQKTLMGYINNGLRVSDLLKMRAAL